MAVPADGESSDVARCTGGGRARSDAARDGGLGVPVTPGLRGGASGDGGCVLLAASTGDVVVVAAGETDTGRGGGCLGDACGACWAVVWRLGLAGASRAGRPSRKGGGGDGGRAGYEAA